MSQFTLLRHRRFGPFFWTQFLGALNDNLLKNSLVILVAFGAASASMDGDTLVNLAGGIFILPFFLFSPTAGQLADKFEKARLVRAVKLLEIGIMVIAAVGFARQSVKILLTALFLTGCQSTIFGPVKYSILPQHLREEELVGGNALVEMGTFVAILVGTMGGGLLMSVPSYGTTIASGACLTIAVLGWVTSLRIPPAPAEEPNLRIDWNVFAEMRRTLALARANRTVFLSILGISWFWFYGALLLAQFPALGRDVLGGNEHLVTVLLTVFSIGIGAGCLLCERLSGEKIEIGLVPFGSIGLSLFVLDLFFATRSATADPGTVGAFAFLGSWHGLRIVSDLILIGAFGGFYIVPLLALVQNRSEPSHRSRIIAGNNLVSAGFMVLAAGAGIGLRAMGVDIPTLFLLTAIVNAGVAVYIYTLVPEFLMRFLIWMLVHTVYRVRHRGLEQIPDEGAAVIVCNHVSFVDALVVAAACRRPIRFVMDHSIFRIPVLNFIFRTGRAIPIASAKENPALKEAAFAEVERALTAGDLVCIFPEGQITRTGDLNPFRPGVERIVASTPVPVVPLALRGLWGSFFSRRGGHAMRHPFRRFWSRIEVVAGVAMAPAAVSAAALQDQVLALRGDLR